MPCIIILQQNKKLTEELPVLYILIGDINGQHILWTSTSVDGRSTSL